MYKIGLTGGIASGKSTVAAKLAELGAPVIDADVIAREVVEAGQPALADIAACFGEDMLLADGTLDRQRLAAVIFADGQARKKLEAILHPAIRAAISQRIAAYETCGTKVVVLDIPLLFETGWQDAVDAVWVVFVEPKLQLTRLQKRNQLSLAEAEQRLAAQMPLCDKVKLADVVLDNSGARQALYHQVETAWAKVVRDA